MHREHMPVSVDAMSRIYYWNSMVVDGYLLDIFINVWQLFEKKVKYVLAMDKILVNVDIACPSISKQETRSQVNGFGITCSSHLCLHACH